LSAESNREFPGAYQGFQFPCWQSLQGSSLQIDMTCRRSSPLLNILLQRTEVPLHLTDAGVCDCFASTGVYVLGTKFPNPRILLSLMSSSELNILQRAWRARTSNRPYTGPKVPSLCPCSRFVLPVIESYWTRRVLYNCLDGPNRLSVRSLDGLVVLGSLTPVGPLVRD
jgi:hypothetical protein